MRKLKRNPAVLSAEVIEACRNVPVENQVKLACAMARRVLDGRAFNDARRRLSDRGYCSDQYIPMVLYMKALRLRAECGDGSPLLQSVVSQIESGEWSRGEDAAGARFEEVAPVYTPLAPETTTDSCYLGNAAVLCAHAAGQAAAYAEWFGNLPPDFDGDDCDDDSELFGAVREAVYAALCIGERKRALYRREYASFKEHPVDEGDEWMNAQAEAGFRGEIAEFKWQLALLGEGAPKRPRAKRPREFAKVSWTVDDILELKPELTRAQAEDFLIMKEDLLRDEALDAVGPLLDQLLQELVGGVGREEEEE
jgi:hypothetical protein